MNRGGFAQKRQNPTITVDRVGHETKKVGKKKKGLS